MPLLYNGRAVSSIFELASCISNASERFQAQTPRTAFDRLFRVTRGLGRALVSPELAHKYGVAQQNAQEVVSVTNLALREQTWYNTARTQKPQVFKSAVRGVEDPFAVNPSLQCDFCRWESLIGVDTFGRIESANVVTGSNLFKYCEPCHGIVVFKHHDPLTFTEQHVAEMLDASQTWLSRAHDENPGAEHPLFIWNCLARAGASQFHGHAQVMLSKVPFPGDEAWKQAASAYQTLYPDSTLYGDMRRAYGAIGLLTLCGSAHDCVSVWPSISPVKDMEIVVMGPSMTSPAFAAALHAALRTLVDDFGSASFNVGILNISLPRADSGPGACAGSPPDSAPVVARVVSRGKLSSLASDFGGLEVFGHASIGHTDPYALMAALKPRLEPFLAQGVEFA